MDLALLNPDPEHGSDGVDFHEASAVVVSTQNVQDSVERLSDEALELWEQLCSDLTDQQKVDFAKLASKGLDDAVDTLAQECQGLLDKSIANKIKHWLEPLYTIADLTGPIIKFATTTAGVPSPTDVVTGGLKTILHLTKAVPDLQHRAIRLLTRMGQKARILQTLNWTLHQKELLIQVPILTLYSDIVTFCCEVEIFFNGHNDSRYKKIKNRISMTFLDKFNEMLSDHVTKFEEDLEQLRDAIVSTQLKQQKLVLNNQRLHMRQEDQFQHHVLQHLQHLQHTGSLLLEDRQAREEMRKLKERKTERKLFTSCLIWLSNIDFHELYRERCDNHLLGTGDWFLDSKKYQDWRNSSQSSLLWLQGTAGSGKSMLAAIAITDVNNDANPEIGVAYALCQRNQQNAQTLVALLRAMIKQLAIQKHNFHPKVIEAYNQAGFGKILERDQAIDLLACMASMFDETYLIIDAVDEFVDPERLITGLLNMLKNNRRSKGCIKILVVNRPISSVEKLLSPHGTRIRPEAENKQDIERYIEVHLPRPEDAKARELCSKKANGMFMWVRLVFENSGGWLADPKDVIEVLNSMPKGLNEIYDVIFNDISSQPNHLRQKAWNVLHWILKGFVPLSWKSMQAATANYTNIQQLSQIDSHSTAENLIELCKHLVCLDHTGHFSFIHESVRWYLDQKDPGSEALKQFQEAGEKAHDNMMNVCLKYLQLKDFDHEIPSTMEEMNRLIQLNPFRKYAATFWGWHAHQGNSGSHKRVIIEYLHSTSRREFCLQVHERQNPSRTKRVHWYHPGSTSALHVVAIFDLPLVLSEIIKIGADQYKADGSGATPLTYSMVYCAEDTVLSFLNLALSMGGSELHHLDLKNAWAYASVRGWIHVLSKLHSVCPEYLDRPLDTDGDTPLILACSFSKETAARKLVELGADVSMRTPSGDTPLIAAASAGLTYLIELFIRHGANPNSQNQIGRTALHISAANNEEIAVEVLLNQGADLMLADSLHGNTAIHQAALNDSPNVLYTMARLRGNHGFSFANDRGDTPLHVACMHDAVHTAEALIALGCPIDAANHLGFTSLHLAVEFASNDMVKLLLLHRASITKTNKHDDTAVHIAAWSSRAKHLKTLLECVPKFQLASLLATLNKLRGTPLHLACSSGCEHSVRLLIDSGADCNATARDASLPLHCAVICGHTHLIAMLLPKTSDANAANADGRTVLHLAVLSGSRELLQQLLEESAKLRIKLDAATVDNINMTPLFMSVSDPDRTGINADNTITEILLPMTPKTTLRNKTAEGYELLHFAALNGDETLVRFLLEHDSDAAATKADCNRLPIHVAIQAGHLEIFELLLPFSLQYLEERSYKGRTALLLALGAKSLAIVYRLLECRVNLQVVDDNGDGPLHMCAALNQLDVFEHLLHHGCRIFQANKQGANPLHMAVRSCSIRIVQALRDSGFTDVTAQDIYGCNASFYAMVIAHPLMINELKTMGIPFDTPNVQDWTASHCAASCGHLEALQNLQRYGINIYAATPGGITPFLLAANNGHVNIVNFYLRARPSVVLDHELWSGQTALVSAINVQSKSTIDLLLAKGMDLKKPDEFGYTPADLMALHSGDGKDNFTLDRETRQHMQRKVIRKALCTILPYQSNSKIPHGSLERLARALRLHGDFHLAKLCMYALNGQNMQNFGSSYTDCDACSLPNMWESIFWCSSCYKDWTICEGCHDDYLVAEKSTPKALLALDNLEEQVIRIRRACAQVSDVISVSNAMQYFSITVNFIETMRASYEQWEKDNKADIRYPNLKRPGQDWLVLVQALPELINRARAIASETQDQLLKQIEDIVWRYDIYTRKNVLDGDRKRFPCHGHEYIKMTRVEYDELKSVHKLYDPKNGRPTSKLIDQIVAKYQIEDVDSQSIAQPLSLEKSEANLTVDTLAQASFVSSKSDPISNNLTHQFDTNQREPSIQIDSPRAEPVVLRIWVPTIIIIDLIAKTSIISEGAHPLMNVSIKQDIPQSNPAPTNQLQSEQGQTPESDDRDMIVRMMDNLEIRNPAKRKRILKLHRILETYEFDEALGLGGALRVADAVEPGFIVGFIEYKYAKLFEQTPEDTQATTELEHG